MVAPIGKLFPKSRVLFEHTSDYAALEAPDPMYWTRHGYAIIVADCPGLGVVMEKSLTLPLEKQNCSTI